MATEDSTDNGSTEHGHYFIKKSFHKPTYCHHCTDLLWGFIGQGLVCKVCNYVVHERCSSKVATPCTSYLTDHIKNPSAHCWSDIGHFKKKFCNVCRRKLDDYQAYRCEVCEYYTHQECKDFVVSDCKQCAIYSPHIDKNTVVHFHHWREGNLPSSSKCNVCKRTCWSGDCLSGYRCEWCGVTAHSNCQRSLPAECHFGTLFKIFLPPYSVTVPRLDFDNETPHNFNSHLLAERKILDDWSSGEHDENGHSIPQSTSVPSLTALPSSSTTETKQPTRSPKEKDVTEKVYVYDGNAAYRDGVHHTVITSKNAPVSAILDQTLRSFYMPPEPKKYYLCIISIDDEEIRLDERYPIKDQLNTPLVGSIASLYLRKKEKERGELPIYIDSLLPLQKSTFSNCEYIPVTRETTVEECIQLALNMFRLHDEDISNYCMKTVLADKAITDSTLQLDERPFHLMQSIGKESLCRARITRLYIQMKEDPHGSIISIFVGNLPTNLSQRQYNKILLDILAQENKWHSIEVIYYEYGSLVITYNCRERATLAYRLLQQASFDDKQFYAMLLPNIQTHMISNDMCPLLVFVNAKSGGCQGQQLITYFRNTLNPHQVFDLSNGGPLPGLYVFRNVEHYRILVCGGDGTVGWVLQCLDNVGQDAVCDSPAIGVLPLGTGNDLARVLRWGPGYTGTEDLMGLLHDVIDAEDIQLDRWTVIFHPEKKESEENKYAIASDAQVADTNEDTTQMFVMNNYMGFGIDAELSLEFHHARQKNPDKFNSRFHNKGVYFKMSLKKMTGRPSRPLNQFLVCEVDGNVIELPHIEGLLVLNILSWASGSNPWGPEREDQFQVPNHWDGMLEVVGVTGVMHMGKISGGLGTAIRLAQGASIRITMKEEIPIHIDGEPWTQTRGQCVILKSALKATMLKKSKNKVRRRNTEPFIPSSEPAQGTSRAQASSQIDC